MIEQRDGEERIVYLARVLFELMETTTAGNETIEYDGTTCDGLCLAQDFLDAVGISQEEL